MTIRLSMTIFVPITTTPTPSTTSVRRCTPKSSPHPVLSGLSVLKSGLQRGIGLLKQWYDRAQQRHALLKLDAHALKDIGINRADALEEGNKPFWKP